MTKTTNKPPQLRQHKASGRAVVTLTDRETGHRRDFYVGDYGVAETHAAYADLIKDWEARGRRLDMTPVPPIDRTQQPALGHSVMQLCLDYARSLEERRGISDGHRIEIKRSIRYARITCGRLSVADFGPKALQDIRQSMINARKSNGKPWTRKTINERMRYVVAMFRWAVANERAPIGLPAALDCVLPLKRGEYGVPEGRKGKSVPEAHIAALRPHVSDVVWAMIQVQLRMVARAGEVCSMRPIDIDMTGKIWIYRPTSHKTEHFGHTLEKYINPACQAFIEPLLVDRPVCAYLFSPREGYAQRRAELGQSKRRDNQAATPRRSARQIRDRYDTSSYNRAIERACKAADVPKWTTHQLRHAGYSIARRQVGVERALLLLGDVSTRMADVYGEKSQAAALVAAEALCIKG